MRFKTLSSRGSGLAPTALGPTPPSSSSAPWASSLAWAPVSLRLWVERGTVALLQAYLRPGHKRLLAWVPGTGIAVTFPGTSHLGRQELAQGIGVG